MFLFNALVYLQRIQNIIVLPNVFPVIYMSVFSYYKTGPDTASYKMLLGSVFEEYCQGSLESQEIWQNSAAG